jgi:hypothetical protein
MPKENMNLCENLCAAGGAIAFASRCVYRPQFVVLSDVLHNYKTWIDARKIQSGRLLPGTGSPRPSFADELYSCCVVSTASNACNGPLDSAMSGRPCL